jgi:hypothetical protein
MILGISGRKQSGKSTTGNFIVSLYLARLEVSRQVDLDEEGRIVVSDLFGDINYRGVLDTSARKNDFMLNKLYGLLDKHVKIYSFADPLKQDICMNILGLTYEQCYGSDDEKNRLTELTWPNSTDLMTSRDIMQYVGTDVFRKMKSDVWVSATINRINKEKPELALITDCRFPNEVSSIKDAGGSVMRLTRNPFHSDHLSETILDEPNYDWSNFNYVCRNDNMNIYEQCTDIQKFLQENLSL